MGLEDLQYKMFLLNSITLKMKTLDNNLQYKMFLLNKGKWWNYAYYFRIYNTKCFY